MRPTEKIQRLEVVTHDVVQAHEAIRDTFAGHRLTIRGSRENFTYRQSTAVIDGLAADALQHTMGVQEDVDPVHHTWIGLIAGGRFRVARSREETRSRRGDLVLFPQGVPFTCEWQTMDLRVVRLPTSVVAELAAARTGIEPADFRFESMSPVSEALAQHCRSTVGYLHTLFRGPDPAVGNPLVQAAAVELAAAAALATFPNTATGTGPNGRAATATPAAVRRTVAYIDEHADEPLTLADIVQASGIGARALQEAFRRHHDTTPTGYLRRVRLERAHRELQAADPTQGSTVSAIAVRWGFVHQGRFATLYRRTYGRSPRETLHS